jgi:hypothetical protein
MPELTFKDFAERYCERQQQTPEGLLKILQDQRRRFDCDGWLLAECQVMDSSFMGSLTILPFGPANSFKTIPDHPFSPRGLASDTSVVVAVLLATHLPE